MCTHGLDLSILPLHSSLCSFSHYLDFSALNPARELESQAKGLPVYCLVKMGVTPPLVHLNLEQPGPPSRLCSPPHHASTCPALTQTIISAQAWVQVQETWSVSHPSPFECVAWPGSLFAKVLLISADLPMIVGRLLFLLLLGQVLASARKTGRTWDSHVCEHICRLP